jgi:hypothetical protein
MTARGSRQGGWCVWCDGHLKDERCEAACPAAGAASIALRYSMSVFAQLLLAPAWPLPGPCLAPACCRPLHVLLGLTCCPRQAATQGEDKVVMEAVHTGSMALSGQKQSSVAALPMDTTRPAWEEGEGDGHVRSDVTHALLACAVHWFCIGSASPLAAVAAFVLYCRCALMGFRQCCICTCKHATIKWCSWIASWHAAADSRDAMPASCMQDGCSRLHCPVHAPFTGGRSGLEVQTPCLATCCWAQSAKHLLRREKPSVVHTAGPSRAEQLLQLPEGRWHAATVVSLGTVPVLFPVFNLTPVALFWLHEPKLATFTPRHSAWHMLR